MSPPRGIGRRLFRLPILLYRLRLGRLLGNRFLLLNHTGRISGLHRKTVLEVVHHDPESGSYMVIAGFGPRSDWYRNVMKRPQVTIQAGGRTMRARAERLSPELAGEVLLGFVKANPQEARFISMLGYRVDGSDEDWRALGRELIVVRLERE